MALDCEARMGHLQTEPSVDGHMSIYRKRVRKINSDVSEVVSNQENQNLPKWPLS